MRLGIDIMGGDYAPNVPLEGTVMALKHLPKDVEVSLFGNKEQIESYLIEKNIHDQRLFVVHAPEVIEMHESPAAAFSQKTNSSITVGFQHLKDNQINAFASAGSTGAMMVGAMQVIKSIEGIIRPCIASIIPKPNGNFSIIADVGLNPDCKPDVLYQYAIIASKYSQFVLGIKQPKVALLNIGTEPEKGNLLVKATYDTMNNSKDFNFIGNIESNELFTDKADVLICDGFVGNIILKMAEGFYSLLKERNLTDDFIQKLNFEIYGGTPILGVNKTIIIGHGASTALAIMNMILHMYRVVKAELVEKIKNFF